jgi:hypothetical protein
MESTQANELKMPDPVISGEGTMTPPTNRAEQVETLLIELRRVRAQKDHLSEIQRSIEHSLALIRAEMTAEEALNKLLPHEKEALKRLAGN